MLSHIVMKAMSKLPEKRYQHAEEMALDLKRYLINEKRSRQRLQREMPMLEHAEPAIARPYRRRLFWIGCFALIGMLAAVTGIKFLH